MSAVAFDTLKFAEKLEAGGFTPQQAKTAAQAFAEATGERLASKDDLAILATKTDLAETKADILKWLFGMIGFQTILILGAVVALARIAH